MKLGFLESAHRGGLEKSSFAMYLVKEILTIFNGQKLSPFPELPPPVLGAPSIPPRPLSQLENPTSPALYHPSACSDEQCIEKALWNVPTSQPGPICMTKGASALAANLCPHGKPMPHATTASCGSTGSVCSGAPPQGTLLMCNTC